MLHHCLNIDDMRHSFIRPVTWVSNFCHLDIWTMTGLVNYWMCDRPGGAQYFYMLVFNNIYASVFLSIRGQWRACLLLGWVSIQPDIIMFALFPLLGKCSYWCQVLVHCRGLLHSENIFIVDWFSPTSLRYSGMGCLNLAQIAHDSFIWLCHIYISYGVAIFVKKLA